MGRLFSGVRIISLMRVCGVAPAVEKRPSPIAGPTNVVVRCDMPHLILANTSELTGLSRPERSGQPPTYPLFSDSFQCVGYYVLDSGLYASKSVTE